MLLRERQLGSRYTGKFSHSGACEAISLEFAASAVGHPREKSERRLA
jgi:hypothetical protein